MNKTMQNEPVAWLFTDIGMTTTHEDERDRWIAAGRTVLPLFTHPAPSQPSAEELVLTTLEATIDALYKVSCECAARHAAIEEAAAAIRALDKQQIIESCKEKS